MGKDFYGSEEVVKKLEELILDWDREKTQGDAFGTFWR